MQFSRAIHSVFVRRTTGNACTDVAKLGPPQPTSPAADAGICIIGDVTFNDYDPFFGNKTVNTVSRTVNGVSVSGLKISGFGVGIIIAGAEQTKISKNIIEGSDSFATLALNSPNTTEEYNTASNGPTTIAGIGMCAQHSPGLLWHENDLSGFITGLCISTSYATVIENSVHDNHFGMQVDPGENHITIRGNHVYDNRRVDPFPIGIPTGIGILITGHDVLVEDNEVTGNYGDNVAIIGQPFGGGILVADNPGPPGHESTSTSDPRKLMRKNTRPCTMAVLLMMVAACGSSSTKAAPPPATFAVDVRPYLSVKELRASSDSVLLGTFGNKTGTQRNNGGNPADTAGIPVAFFEFVVSRVLSGRDLGPMVQVVVLDAASTNGDVVLQPQPGQQVVIFAQELSATNAPGLKLSGPTINAVSGNNGVFDVVNGRARARLFVVSINQNDVVSTSTLPPAGLPRLLDIDLAELELAVNQTP
jgi:Right handed beta helix region